MSDNTIYMREKENPPRIKEEYSVLTATVYPSGESKNSPKAKSASLKIPMPLVRKIEGPFNSEGKLVEEMLEGQEYIFKVTEHDKSMHSLIKHIWWAEKLDDGEIVDLEYEKHVNPYWDDETKNKGVKTWDEELVCYKYKAKKATKIRIYAYVASPSESVSIEVPIVSFPLCVDRYQMPGLNRDGSNIAEDLTYGKGIANKTFDTFYDNKIIEKYKKEYLKSGFDINKHAKFANADDDKITNPFDNSFEPSTPQAGSDYFDSFQKNINQENELTLKELADDFDKKSYSKAIYSKEQIYKEKAWLIKDKVFDYSGKDIKDYNDGNLMFWDTSDDNMFKNFEFWATLCFSYGEMQENIKRMIAKFKRNEGGIYEDNILTNQIANNPHTQEYCMYLEDYIAEKIKNNNGKFTPLLESGIDWSNGGWDDRKEVKGKTTTNKDKQGKYIGFARPKFDSWSDRIRGETIALNDIWATEVYITDIKQKGKDYLINYKVTLWDHFGLDISDIQDVPNTIPLAKEAFAVWFALQHLRGYKPFITKMTFERKFKGNIENGKFERNAERLQKNIEEWNEETKDWYRTTPGNPLTL